MNVKEHIMGQSVNSAGFISKAFRMLFSTLDWAIYTLLIVVYQVFFNVASARILEGDTIKAFFGRIQIILGIFVLFKLAINLINVIINPDQLGSDKSGQGFSQIVVRVVISLIMLVAVMPMNIPGAKRDANGDPNYASNLSDNGLLFGTLYEFQDRVLASNTLAKLIIGSPYQSGEEERANMKNAGNQLSSFVLKGFIRVNLKPDAEDEYDSSSWMCPDNEDEVKKYLSANISPNSLLDMITLTCKSTEGTRYVFTYMMVVSTVVGAIFLIIMIGFVLDIAIRAFKLAILRLIAPIPIISYIDPKSSKDGAFASWIKAVMTTYLDLFLRLAIVFFVIFIIQDIMINGLYIDSKGGLVGAISWIFIILGLLYFAKQAPRFITTSLGIKSMGLSGVGLSGAMGFIGGVIGGGGLGGALTAGLTAANTAGEAAAQGKAAPSAYSTGRDLIAKMKTGDDKAQGGILNTAQRRMMINSKAAVGARKLKSMGITAAEADKAKTLMFQAQDQAANIASLRSRFDVGAGQDINRLSASDQQMIKDFNALHAGDRQVSAYNEALANYENEKRSGTLTEEREQELQSAIRAASTTLMDHMVNTSQTEFKKQEAYYKDADTLLKKYGNDLTLEDKYAGGIRRHIARRSGNPGAGKGTWSRYYGDQGHSRGTMDFKQGQNSNNWSDRTHTK